MGNPLKVQFGAKRNSRASHYWFRQSLRGAAALVLAVLLGLFLVQTASHLHENHRDEAACNRCHLAHVSLALGSNNSSLFVPLPVTATAFPLVLTFHQDPFSPHSSSRAPPAD